MTGLVRKATLFGVCGLLAASAALANVPDPTTSTVPKWLYAVGVISNAIDPGLNGFPDMDGAGGRSFRTPFFGPTNVSAPDNNVANVITIKDFSGLPISGVGVTINLPCDFNLCKINFGPSSIPDPDNPGQPYILTGQTVLDVDPSKGYCTLRGVTDAAGQWKFAIVGATKIVPTIPCNDPGCVFPGGHGSNILGFDEETVIKVDGYPGDFAYANTIAFDQDGSGTPTSNGVTALDAGLVLQESLGFNLGVNTTPVPLQPAAQKRLYRARYDHDQSRLNSALDAALHLTHSLRVGVIGTPATSTCTTNIFCGSKPTCTP